LDESRGDSLKSEGNIDQADPGDDTTGGVEPSLVRLRFAKSAGRNEAAGRTPKYAAFRRESFSSERTALGITPALRFRDVLLRPADEESEFGDQQQRKQLNSEKHWGNPCV